MSLAINERFDVSHKNLQTILHATKKEPNWQDSFICPVAKRCFEEIQSSQLGIFHTIKKYSAAGVVDLVTRVTPFALLALGCWRYKDELLELSMTTLANNYVAIGAASAGYLALEKVWEKYTNASLSSLILFTIYDFYRQNANRLSDGMLRSYETKEQAVKQLTEQHHQTIIEKQKIVYQEMAKALGDRFRSLENNPEGMRIFIPGTIKRLEKQFNLIHEALGGLNLTTAEIETIINPLREVTEYIKQYSMSFKTEKGSEEFNTNLMLNVSNAEFRQIAIPKAAKDNLRAAKRNQLGWGHSLKAIIHTGFSGTIPSIASAAIAQAARMLTPEDTLSKYDFATNAPQSYLIVSSIALGVLGLGFLSAKNTYSHYKQERLESDCFVKEQKESASEMLETVYGGIAKKINALEQEEKSKLKNLLPILQKELKETGLTIQSEIYDRLAVALTR